MGDSPCCNLRTASFTRLLFFSSVCRNSYGSSIASSSCFLQDLWRERFSPWPPHTAGSDQDRHGMWYGEGRELRVGWWAGLAFRRRFSRISWTSSSTASTSLACLLGIVGLLLPLLLPRISATTTGGCTSCSLCSIIATLTRTRASGTNHNHFNRNFPNSARNGGSSCAVYRYGTIHHNHTRARSTV